MTMEGALIERRRERVEHVNKVGYAHKPIKKKRRKTRIQRYVKPKVPRALQELFVACRDVFKGPGTVPAPCDVNKLCKILGNYSSFQVFSFFNFISFWVVGFCVVFVLYCICMCFDIAMHMLDIFIVF